MRGIILAWVGLVAVLVACGGETVVTPMPSWQFSGLYDPTVQSIDKVDLLLAIGNSS